MSKNFFSLYKFPLLISLTLFLAIIAIKVLRSPIDISGAFLGCMLGTFVLDMEYVIYAYFLEPEKDFSKTLIAFVKHKDLNNAAQFIYYHKDEFKDKSLNSAIFQVVMAAVSIFVVSATTSFFIKALVLSIFASTLYKFAESYFENKTAEWFWTFKSKPNKSGLIIYSLLIITVFVYCLRLL
jgi:hypothetical protein